jgi:hypothetical protein
MRLLSVRYRKAVAPFSGAAAHLVLLSKVRSLHLLGSIQLQPTRPDRSPRLHRHLNTSSEGLPPRRQEVRLDRSVLRDSRIGDLVPRTRVRCQGAGKFIVRAGGSGLEGRGGECGSATKGVREGLVLLRSGLHGWGCGKVRAL